MKKISKTEIKQVVENALTQVLEQLDIPKPSRKTKKTISKISRQIKLDWKKQAKKAQKSNKRNGKGHAKAESAAA